MIAQTPPPPYTAVIFTSVQSEDLDGYAEMDELMARLVEQQPGYLGRESARDGIGITVSYWATAEDARAWKNVAEHRLAQQTGRERWYEDYRVRVASVEREYGK